MSRIEIFEIRFVTGPMLHTTRVRRDNSPRLLQPRSLSSGPGALDFKLVKSSKSLRTRLVKASSGKLEMVAASLGRRFMIPASIRAVEVASGFPLAVVLDGGLGGDDIIGSSKTLLTKLPLFVEADDPVTVGSVLVTWLAVRLWMFAIEIELPPEPTVITEPRLGEAENGFDEGDKGASCCSLLAVREVLGSEAVDRDDAKDPPRSCRPLVEEIVLGEELTVEGVNIGVIRYDNEVGIEELFEFPAAVPCTSVVDELLNPEDPNDPFLISLSK